MKIGKSLTDYGSRPGELFLSFLSVLFASEKDKKFYNFVHSASLLRTHGDLSISHWPTRCPMIGRSCVPVVLYPSNHKSSFESATICDIVLPVTIANSLSPSLSTALRGK